jgi:hypothetical protein
MRNSTHLGNGAVALLASAIGLAFIVPVVQSLGQDGASIMDGSAPTIAGMIYALMLPLLCVSAPGVLGRALGVCAAALSGLACGQAAALAQAGEMRLTVGLVIVAVLMVALVVTAMRALAARRRRDVLRLVRRLHSLADKTTATLRDRYHDVPLHRDAANPMADAMLVDRLVNGAIGGAAGATDRNSFFRDFIASLRDLHDSVSHQNRQGYAVVCLEEHLRAQVGELRREGAELGPRRRAAVHGHGQTAH